MAFFYILFSGEEWFSECKVDETFSHTSSKPSLDGVFTFEVLITSFHFLLSKINTGCPEKNEFTSLVKFL